MPGLCSSMLVFTTCVWSFDSRLVCNLEVFIHKLDCFERRLGESVAQPMFRAAQVLFPSLID